MFERYLADALTTHFGHLIEDFDTDKVRISVWNGAVVLKDLRLKNDALQHILPKSNEGGDSSSSDINDADNFPCDIVYGHIGTFELHIPWHVFRRSQQLSSWLWSGGAGTNTNKTDRTSDYDSSDSYSIVLSDVKILVTQKNPHEKTPHDRNDDDSMEPTISKKDLTKTRVEKERMVQRILNSALFRKNVEIASSIQGQQHHSSDMNDGGKERSKRLWIKNLVKGIISKLSITVKNVHLRYEDLGDRNDIGERPPFAIGLTLAEFSLSTTQNGPLEEKELFDIPSIKNCDFPERTAAGVHDNSPDSNMNCAKDRSYTFQHKLAATKNLAVYWDSDVSAKNLVHATVLRGRQLRRGEKTNEDLMSGRTHTSASSMMKATAPLHRPSGRNDTQEESEENRDVSQHNNEILTQEDNILYSSMLQDIVGDSVGSQEDGLDIFHNAQSSLKDCWGHTYIMQPISPSLHFTIVSAITSEKADHLTGGKDEDDLCSGLTGDSGEKVNCAREKSVQPPSRGVLILPPIEINVTKDTLEDIAYIRKSIALWSDMRTSLLSQQIYVRLTKSRPSISPLNDPIGWWRYAFEAVKTFSNLTSPKKETRHQRGWLGLTRLLKCRNEYILLYKKLLESDVSSSEKDILNETINLLEDELNPSEVAAFRLYLFVEASKIKEDESSGTKENPANLRNNWTEWIYPWGESQTKNGVTGDSDSNRAIYSREEMQSHKYRELIYLEMTRVLKLERKINHEELYHRTDRHEYQKPTKLGLEKGTSNDSKLEMSIVCPQLIIRADDIIQKNARRRCQPIVQMSCASVQKLCLRRNSTWDANFTFASLEILDLMKSTETSDTTALNLKLLSRKRSTASHCYNLDGNISEARPIKIGEASHFHSATIYVRKALTNTKELTKKESGYLPKFMTSVSITISPMEAVYSYEPFQALSQMFSTANTAEFVGDYERLKHAISVWKAKQQHKLMEVLAKQEKKVIINIDVAAPVLLIDDETSDETLIIDLGRLTFFNVDNVINERPKQYDDTWKLLVENIQVFSASLLGKKRIISIDNHSGRHKDVCHLVEPFSIELIISTKIGNLEDGLTLTRNNILIKATLPRLVFNLQSACVRLVQRLYINRDFRILHSNRQKTNPTFVVRGSTIGRSSPAFNCDQKHFGNKQTEIEFNFSAPLIALRLSNNVDVNLDQSQKQDRIELSATPIIDLVVQGIGGRFLHVDTTRDGNNVTFVARIKSLYAKDLYQQAGKEFSMILSSRQPESLHDGGDTQSSSFIFDISNEKGGKSKSDSDLVSLHYDSHKKKHSNTSQSNLKINFHELYVNWNPETIAVAQKAMQLSVKEIQFMSYIHRNLTEPPPSFEEEMVFFDTVESAETHSMKKDKSFLSEPSLESSSGYSQERINTMNSLSEQVLSPLAMNVVTAMGTQHNTPDKNFLEKFKVGISKSNTSLEEVSTNPVLPSTLNVTFVLSKLRIQFNKESRHRRLINAEMCKLLVNYESKTHGGSTIKANVQNIVFYDPSSITGHTLYGQILGPKSEYEQGSMLEISYETYPRISGDLMQANDSKSVHVDLDNRIVTGCDSSLSLRFSPMRFVMLQQLWLEIIDYFFQGIMGNEVWGRFGQNVGDDVKKEHGDDVANVTNGHDSSLVGADAHGISFMRIFVVMESPVVLLPATYRSTSYLRFDFDNIEVTNEFNGQIEQNLESNIEGCPYVQWYNNYCILFRGLNLMSWCGTHLNISSDPKIRSTEKDEDQTSSIDFTLEVRWPIGPKAINVIPKWNVHFRIGSLRLLLLHEDYVLFQHILWHNIGEESRHLDEWNALQLLPSEELLDYKKKILVHFGYDKKDSAPTTFNIVIDIESIKIHFCYNMKDHVADVTCSKLIWSLLKKKDRITQQRLICNSIKMVQTSGNLEWSRFTTLLFPFTEFPNSTPKKAKSSLIYTSTSRPNGDNVKYLEINNTCIYGIYPAWIFISKFFQVPEIDLMTNDEVLNCIQVADRWYKINTNQAVDATAKWQKEKEKQDPKNEILSNFQCRILLTSPHIFLVSDSSISDQKQMRECKTLTLQLSQLDFLHTNNPSCGIIARSLFVHDLELFTGDPTQKDFCSQEHSLLHPLNLGCGSKSNINNGNTTESCKWVVSDVISARAAFTDMTMAVDVVLNAMSDFGVVAEQPSKRIPISTIECSEERLKPQIATSSKIRSASRELRDGDLPNSAFSSNDSDLSHVNIKEYIGFACGGFDLVVIDDSGRHFASAQELVQIGLCGVKFNRSDGFSNAERNIVTQLQLHQFEMHDLLQPLKSPFRVVVTGNHEANIRESTSANDINVHRNSFKRLRLQKMNRTVWDDFMTKENYSMIEHKSWGYIPSSFMLDRYQIARSIKIDTDMDTPCPILVEIKHTSLVGIKKSSISFKIGTIVAQWNPSMAIALQRFLGRLKKETKSKQLASQKNGNSVDFLSKNTTQNRHNAGPTSIKEVGYSKENSDMSKDNVQAKVEIDSFTLCLNKEHQRRRLLQVTLSKSIVNFERNQVGMFNINGSVEDFIVWDPDEDREGQISICESNRMILRVIHNDDTKTLPCRFDRFLSFRYYSQPPHSKNDARLKEAPPWVTELVGTSTGDIDDCLSLEVATVRANYLNERTGEIIDYLSNGLPGKGMGATAAKAKGFINKRIKTRSFLDLSIDAPELLIPQQRGSKSGVFLCLGDVHLRSWFDEATLQESKAMSCEQLGGDNQIPVVNSHASIDTLDEKYCWRVLSVSILGLGWQINTLEHMSQKAKAPVNLHLLLRKSSSNDTSMIVRCRLSFTECVLTYREYVLLQNVLRDNLTKKIDKSSWDNVEKAFFMEESTVLHDDEEKSPKYSKSARFVRYGTMAQQDITSGPTSAPRACDSKTEQIASADKGNLDLMMQVDSLHLTLHRDDSVNNTTPDDDIKFQNYDMVAFQVKKVKISLVIDSARGNTCTMSFHQVALFDVGDKGRLSREQYSHKLCKNKLNSFPWGEIVRKPSVFSAICFSGHELPTESNSVEPHDEKETSEPELKITIKTSSPSDLKLGSTVRDHGEVITVCVEINHVNINLLIRPLLEVAEFFSCKWSSEDHGQFRDIKTVKTFGNNMQGNVSNSVTPVEKSNPGGFEVKIIAHYPTIYFLLDESDLSTKALVLRGLAVVNASVMKEETSTKLGLPVEKSDSHPKDIQSMTSIEVHFHSLESYINPNVMDTLGRITPTTSHNLIYGYTSNKSTGFALIEPVTATFDFQEQRRGARFPIIRTVYVNMEPVSITLSFEDIRLIDAVISRWKTEKGWQKEQAIKHKSNGDLDTPNNDDITKQDNPSTGEVFLNNNMSTGDVFDQDIQDIQDTVIDEENNSLRILNHVQPVPEKSDLLQKTMDKQTKLINSSGDFEVEFHSEMLGLVLRKAGLSIVVDNVTVADSVKEIHRGDEILSIGEMDISGIPLQSIVQHLKSAPRPTIIRFRRKDFIGQEVRLPVKAKLDSLRNNKSEDASDNILPAQRPNGAIIPITRSFCTGFELGFQLERSVCGDIAVVKSIDCDQFIASLLEEQDKYYRPKPGTIILGVGDVLAHELGYEGTLKFFHSKVEMKEDDSYEVTFVEPSINDWGPVEKIDIVISRVTLTLIDDLNGRDMPLVRGSLNPFVMKLERGLGLQCDTIKVVPPSLFQLDQTGLLYTDFLKYKDNDDVESSHHVISDLSEAILKLSTTSEINFDYYNARIGIWEPVIEPCHLSAEIEYQKGNNHGHIPRPASVSIAISDYSAILKGESLKQSLVCINITDAAFELFLTTAYELKAWQQRYKFGETSEDVLPHKDVTLQTEKNLTSGTKHHQTSNLERQDVSDTRNITASVQTTQNINNADNETGRQRVAAQSAARAALIFAQRRGADSQKVSEAKPFIFRNETGMCIEYVVQIPENITEEISSLETSFDLKGYKSSAINKVDDGEEACFSMDPVSSDDFNLAYSNNPEGGPEVLSRDTKKIRTYDSQFPFLSVLIKHSDCAVGVEILRDMSVVKSGQHLKRLSMRKLFKRQRLIHDTEEEISETGFVIVVWSVTLENNRRIINLSSAVSIASPDCGIPIEIGVKQFHNDKVKGAKNNIENIKSVKSIGVSTIDNPFFLPIWIDLCFKSAEIYIRPVSECNINDNVYQWSTKHILKFERKKSTNLSYNEVGASNAWIWQPNETYHQIFCHPRPRTVGNELLLPVWLSWSQQLNCPGRTTTSVKRQLSNIVEKERRYSTICICISSGLRIRNTVPDNIEWEVSSGMEMKLENNNPVSILDGSSFRRQQQKTIGFIPLGTNGVEDECHLQSGFVTDVHCCDMSSKIAHVRFRCNSHGEEWSEWSLIHLPASKLYNERNLRKEGSLNKDEATSTSVEDLQQSRQINIQSKSDFGPIPSSAFGLKIVTKTSSRSEGTRLIRVITGYDLILFTKLWFCNFTHLNLVFGAPSNQIHLREKDDVIMAEAAMLELSSILEFGDKGISREGDDSCHGSNITIISKQQSNEVVDEVFEYVEIHRGIVKRRWWANELHSSLAHSPSAYDCLDGTEWVWAEKWQIDISGACNANEGGWESCLNLVGGKGRSFSGQRQFIASHPFRRRRFFRRRIKRRSIKLEDKSKFKIQPFHLSKLPGIGTTAFHHPTDDSKTYAGQEEIHDPTRKNVGVNNGPTRSFLDVVGTDRDEDSSFKIAFKIGDSRWSDPAIIPPSGTAHGVVRVFASRWREFRNNISSFVEKNSESNDDSLIINEKSGCSFEAKFHDSFQSQVCYELSYHVSVIEGPWGELSRCLTIHPRFFVRNDCGNGVYVKQVGSPDFSSIRVESGNVIPFYWADTHLPELICMRPASMKSKSKSKGQNSSKRKSYRWSGGFDPCSLGMIPLRIRGVGTGIKTDQRMQPKNSSFDGMPAMKVIRVLIEIRSGTGGSGIIISFKEELPNGEDSLYRIENNTPFPIWIAQDGVLANPHHDIKLMNIPENLPASIDNYRSQQYSQGNGDLVSPLQHLSFGLDVPFRQGKYAGRSAASLQELLRLKVSLAPLATRDGVESMKVTGLSSVGERIYLNPCKLRSHLDKDTRAEISCIRVRGLVCTDGPTRVLKFSLVQRYTRSVLRKTSAINEQSHASILETTDLCDKMKYAASRATIMLQENKIPIEREKETIGGQNRTSDILEANMCKKLIALDDSFYYIRASFSGFVFSIIDGVPTEIALISLRKVEAMAEWSRHRSTETTIVLSIGWIQIDNHCPNAPFPIALCPDEGVENGNKNEQEETSHAPFLNIGLVFAPRHKSGIVCLKGMSIDPRDVSLSTDLGFIFRMQSFLLGLYEHLDCCKRKHEQVVSSVNQSNLREIWTFPDFHNKFKSSVRSTAASIETQKFYFEGVTILPFTIKLSVAPTVALTSAQASLEGSEAAEMHAAVRKGDVLLIDGVGVLGVELGTKNQTALAVIRGIFKSILVDGLLRCDGASMDFHGVHLRNHLSTIPQLKTILGNYYMSSLKRNVPALLGSLAAFGNPVGLIRGFGDGFTDFVVEPVEGLKRSLNEGNPSHVIDGVARGTGSLARHAVGGIVDSTSLLTSTFSKNMAVLTLDRNYAHRRDRLKILSGTSTTFVEGVESGVGKLIRGVAEGVIGVVRAPMRGAEKRGVTGFAKGVGKGVLGLVVKPVIGLSDAVTDVMVGFKGSIEGAGQNTVSQNMTQLRPKRPFYGCDRVIRRYEIADAITAAFMMSTRLAGDNYLSHCDMGGRVAILSVNRFLLLGSTGESQLLIKFKHINHVELRQVPKIDGRLELGVLIFFKVARKNGNEVEVITTEDKNIAIDLFAKIKEGVNLMASM